MTDDTPKPKVTSGELVDSDPFTRTTVPRPSAIPLFERVQKRSETKTIETYVGLAKSRNALLSELKQEVALEADLLIGRVHLDAVIEELHTIKEGERSVIRGQFVAAQKSAELAATDRDLEIIRKKKEIADIKKSIEDLDKPPAAPQREPTLDEKMQRGLEALRKLNAVFDQHIAQVKAQAGDGPLTDDLEAHIDQAEMLRKIKIDELWGKLR